MLNDIKKELEDKGYHVSVCCSFNKSRTECLNDCLLELVNSGELELNDNVKKIIDMYEEDDISIIFQEHYQFNVLPIGYKYLYNELFFSCLCFNKKAKEIDDIERKQLNILSKWVDGLININYSL